ncbi:MAG: CPBP family intramembrane metalloprotease [Clostridia bacterium]|nr:CPBP family intramembrane metalloprotease [Clostridia bacterium]
MYNNINPMQNSAVTYENKRLEKKELRKLGTLAGAALMLFIAFQLLSVLFLVITGLKDEYYYDRNITYSIGTLISIFSIFVPFFLIWICLKDKKRACLNFGKPYDSKLMLYAVPIGMMICMIGNFVTNYISLFFENAFGIVFESPDLQTPTSPLGMMAFFLQVAFVPALVEEFAIRGVVMMPLRKYGNAFAIVVSALIFGLMHGNIIQATFAFIVGLGLGYLAITTGSMWTGVIIHFFNNLFSCVITLLYDYTSETQVNIVYYICVIVFFASGIVCTALFIQRANKKQIPIRFKKPAVLNKPAARFGAYIINIPMIIAIIYLIYSTSQYVSRV